MTRKMTRQTKILGAISAFTLLGLIFLHVMILRQAYKMQISHDILHFEERFFEMMDLPSPLDTTFGMMSYESDSLLISNEYWRESDAELVRRFVQTVARHQKPFEAFIYQEWKNLGYSDHFNYELRLVSWRDLVQSKAIVSASSDPVILFGNIEDGSEAIASQKILGTESRSFLEIDVYYQLPKLHSEALQKMILLLMVNTIILIGLVALFLSSLNAFLTQQKVANLKTRIVNSITSNFRLPIMTIRMASASLKSNVVQQDTGNITLLSHLIGRQNQRLLRMVDDLIENRFAPESKQEVFLLPMCR